MISWEHAEAMTPKTYGLYLFPHIVEMLYGIFLFSKGNKRVIL